MSTQTRLDAYLVTEARILKAQETRGGDRSYRQAELEQVTAMIEKLTRQLGRESQAAAGKHFGFSVANMNRT